MPFFPPLPERKSVDYGQPIQNMLAVDQAVRGRKMDDMRMRAMESEMQREEQFRNALVNYSPDDPEAMKTSVANALRVDPVRGIPLANMVHTQTGERQAQAMDMLGRLAAYLYSAPGNVRPQVYTQAYTAFSSQFPEFSQNLPATYPGDEQLHAFVAQYVPIDQQMELMKRQQPEYSAPTEGMIGGRDAYVSFDKRQGRMVEIPGAAPRPRETKEGKSTTPHGVKWFSDPVTKESKAFAYGEPVPAGWTPITTPKQEAGELSDNSVLQNIRELSNFDQAKTAQLWSAYRKARSKGMSRAEALEMVQSDAVDSENTQRLSDLGKKYPSPDAVKKAFKKGELSQEEATAILQRNHGYE